VGTRDVLPLKGIRVADITRLLPGGFCTYLLSSYGAEVVKVEEPGLGDYVRNVPPMMDGVSLVHTMINRGKRSIGIDLKDESGKDVLRRLIERSDVFIEGFRPGAVDRLGFSFDQVKRINKRVVYCSISSFGHGSPLSSMPAHDLNFEAMSGLIGSDGRPQVPFVQLGDYVSGMYAAIGILAALRNEKRTAVHIDVPIVQSLMSLLVLPASSYFTTKRPPARGQGLVFGSEPYYSVYRASDGRYLAVAAIEPHLWKNLMRVLGLSRIAGLRDGTERDRRVLRKEMQRAFSSRTQEAWSSALMGKDTAVTPVLDIDEALEASWAKESGTVGTVTGRPVLNQPLRFSSRPDERAAPSLGEHTDSILRELGYGVRQVKKMRLSGAVA
jgi:crotonobetainyl-CoA:carnitine CoA-transferase CaiB-like acyl-CoA transferase